MLRISVTSSKKAHNYNVLQHDFKITLKCDKRLLERLSLAIDDQSTVNTEDIRQMRKNVKCNLVSTLEKWLSSATQVQTMTFEYNFLTEVEFLGLLQNAQLRCAVCSSSKLLATRPMEYYSQHLPYAILSGLLMLRTAGY